MLLRLSPEAGSGIAAWTLAGVAEGDVDGLAIVAGPDGDALAGAPASHPNEVVSIDHVVVLTDDLERTAAVLDGLGAPLRRRRRAQSPLGPVSQGFLRLGEAILEAVEPQRAGALPPGAARFWGITFVSADLERCASLLGERLGRIRDAVQPGRRIAPLRPSAGIGLAVAFIMPDPRRS